MYFPKEWILVGYVFLTYFRVVSGIMFHLQPNTHKCLREEIKDNELVSAHYEVSEIRGFKVDVIVTDSKRHTLAKQEDVKKNGKFTFITEHHDVFEVCFFSRAPIDHRDSHEVMLKLLKRAEIQSSDVLGEASMLKPMEVELKNLEILADAIVKDFMEMREREKQMRDTNESTNYRVFYLSVFSLVVLIGLALWQVLYLKNYFKAKKLI